MRRYLFLLFVLLNDLFPVLAVDANLKNEWSQSGSNYSVPATAKKISILEFGGKADNATDNSTALQNAIKSLNGNSGVIEIPAGNFLIKKTISIPSNILIKGKGSDKTILNFNLNGNGDLFSIQGNVTNISSPVLSGTVKGSSSIKVSNPAGFAIGDYVLVKQSANTLLESNWAYSSFFQIVKITKISGNEITISTSLHLDFPASNNPVLQKINPVQNTGIESLKIKRSDVTSGQTSNIFFNYAVNCWVKGVELENCNYAHITLQSSANTTISGNYLHDAFDYGSGGKGYGVVMQFGASDNFIFDNIAKHLRHSFLLQAAANGNVISYNYSYDPYWTEGWFPAASAGDVVLHGNYPYANLFEGNIFQNLVIDNSHGINGPYNTFFRNRIENYGIVMNGNSGDNMHFIANEITGSGLLKGLYNIEGSHTEIANNVKGSLQSGNVTESSLINKNYSSKIGAPNAVGSWKNEAYIRNGKAVKTIASNTTKSVSETVSKTETTPVKTKTTKKLKKKCCVKKKK
ncbi:MAG: right-handed parallel beta-helix repeat-containing protein [Sphingobacteriales bacterium]|nr:right-handed parallel beta-helix repeat-containing protein [Sphingobacteriales bacterium]